MQPICLLFGSSSVFQSDVTYRKPGHLDSFLSPFVTLSLLSLSSPPPPSSLPSFDIYNDGYERNIRTFVFFGGIRWDSELNIGTVLVKPGDLGPLELPL